jgi:uncharacterized protein YciI
MKQYRFFLIILIYFIACNSSDDNLIKENKQLSGQKYNPDLATKLGADKYGMSKYVFAFLKSGPNRSQDSTEAINLQKAHLDNIKRLADEGKLVLAGPFLDDGEIRGIYIFNVSTIEEARKLTETDPAIKAGRLVMDLHPWYGSAALKQVNDLHALIAEKGF